jgi:Flp pilus assembly protein TadD
MTIRYRAALIAGVLLGISGAALAAGGGGISSGPDIPSETVPEYDPAVEYQKGLTALTEERWKDAESALQRVTRAMPSSAEAWRLLGVANSKQDDLKGARRAYERAVKLDPDNINGRLALGLALAGLKDSKAQEQLTWLKSKAQACGSCGDATTLKAAADRLEAAIAGSPAAALETPGTMLFSGPAAGDAAYVSAVSLINDRRYDDALAELSRAREAFGPHPDILTYQGYAWRKKGDLVRAEGYYREALAIAPDHVGATEYYGELKVERGDIAGAQAMLAKLDQVCTYGCVQAEELRRWIAAGREPLS